MKGSYYHILIFIYSILLLICQIIGLEGKLFIILINKFIIRNSGYIAVIYLSIGIPFFFSEKLRIFIPSLTKYLIGSLLAIVLFTIFMSAIEFTILTFVFEEFELKEIK